VTRGSLFGVDDIRLRSQPELLERQSGSSTATRTDFWFLYLTDRNLRCG
jgi:hypothetical protein